jgi:hypothetical protein
MRKKSHISLARFMVENLQDEDLKKHRLSFYVGSVLPDIKPSFLYKRHEMTGTFPDLRVQIGRLSDKAATTDKKSRKYYMDLGQVSHYLADYFTYPHNKIYPGGFKEHCSYEEKLKRDLREFIKSGEASRKRWITGNLANAEAVCRYIQNAHDEYIGHKHNVEDDIRSIIMVNCNALRGMLKPAQAVGNGRWT